MDSAWAYTWWVVGRPVAERALVVTRDAFRCVSTESDPLEALEMHQVTQHNSHRDANRIR